MCALPDHAPLPPPLLARLHRCAEAHGALLATTAKDAARLSAAERDGLVRVSVRVALVRVRVRVALVRVRVKP